MPVAASQHGSPSMLQSVCDVGCVCGTCVACVDMPRVGVLCVWLCNTCGVPVCVYMQCVWYAGCVQVV